MREWGSAKMRRRIITSKINSNWILMSGALKTQFQGKLQYSSNHYTPLLNEMTSSATRKSPWLQAQVAPLVNADTDHEASRWLDGEGDCFKKGVVMEEVSRLEYYAAANSESISSKLQVPLGTPKTCEIILSLYMYSP